VDAGSKEAILENDLPARDETALGRRGLRPRPPRDGEERGRLVSKLERPPAFLLEVVLPSPVPRKDSRAPLRHRTGGVPVGSSERVVVPCHPGGKEDAQAHGSCDAPPPGREAKGREHERGEEHDPVPCRRETESEQEQEAAEEPEREEAIVLRAEPQRSDRGRARGGTQHGGSDLSRGVPRGEARQEPQDSTEQGEERGQSTPPGKQRQHARAAQHRERCDGLAEHQGRPEGDSLEARHRERVNLSVRV
jgi:hypothetical protein